MTPNPHDLQADGFPHGTLDGERAGCSASVCPATPLTCTEVARSYRTDMKFKRLYNTGLRGQELVDVYQDGKPTAPAEPKKPKRSPVAAPEAERFASLDQEAQYRKLLEWRDEGMTPGAIATMIGMRAPSVGRMLTAASRRLDAIREETQTPAPEPAPREQEQEQEPRESAPLEAEAAEAAPVPAASAAARFGVPPMDIDDIPGPQLLQAWVVVDREKRIVAAFVDPEEAVPALAEAWRRETLGAGS